MVIELEILGTPAPKGSARAFMSRGPVPRAILTNSGSKVNEAKLGSWDQAVRLAANRYTAGREGQGPVFVDTPLFVSMVFRVRRPAGHWRRAGGLNAKGLREPYPKSKPDLDKYVRATLDSMKGSIYDDDGRIVAKPAVKLYAKPGQEGASILITEATPELMRSLAGDAVE